MPAEDFSELTLLTNLRLCYLFFFFFFKEKENFTILYINSVMLRMAQIILFIASVKLCTTYILLQIDTEVQCSRFLQVSVHDEDAAEYDNAYLSHKFCD